MLVEVGFREVQVNTKVVRGWSARGQGQETSLKRQKSQAERRKYAHIISDEGCRFEADTEWNAKVQIGSGSQDSERTLCQAGLQHMVMLCPLHRGLHALIAPILHLFTCDSAVLFTKEANPISLLTDFVFGHAVCSGQRDVSQHNVYRLQKHLGLLSAPQPLSWIE